MREIEAYIALLAAPASENIYACFKLLSVQISQRAHERLRHDVLFPLFGEVPSTENFSSC